MYGSWEDSKEDGDEREGGKEKVVGRKETRKKRGGVCFGAESTVWSSYRHAVLVSGGFLCERVYWYCNPH